LQLTEQRRETRCKPIISITGADLSAFNTVITGLKKAYIIKSFLKKFNATGVSEIDVVHYGTTDALLTAILSNYKDIITEKNVSECENGIISLTF